jgi:para-aminobenzoate synthetase component I
MKPLTENLRIDKTAFNVYKHFSAYPYSFLLDSGMAPESLGRFSFIGIEPFMIFSSKGRNIKIDRQGWKKSFTGNPFYVLKDLLGEYRSDFRDAGLPFWGGAAGWFSYDMKHFLEDLPDTAPDDLNIPDCEVAFYDAALVFDNLKKKAHISSSGFPEKGRKRILRAGARLDNIKSRLESLERNGENNGEARGKYSTGELKSNFTRDEYTLAVRKIQEYIKKGDVYQVNLSQRFSAETDADPFSVYTFLRNINPAPFAAYLNFGDVKIASASPERFIKVENKNIETRPIKGTRPRGKNEREDIILKKDLVGSVKDRAENLMIVDLERNDLGRICKYGSVKVNEFMTCEEFPTVFHLTSNIKGRIRDKIDAIDVLANCFPGGSITGAPKIRAMEIIEELETVKRSVYTGAIGYIGFNGDMDTSIVIRTLVFHEGKVCFSVGGGIVHDSVPEKEYEETLHKARALIEAIANERTQNAKSFS